ncbi:Protein kinase alk2 [Actinomortierella ambigua]|nr:Protein kinase alk2 [Actinomortierella ambigua]
MLMFGLDLQSLANKGQNEFGDAFEYLSQMANNRIFNPAFVITELLPWTLIRKRRAMAILDKYAAKAVEGHRRESPEQKSQRHSDLLDHFMRYKTEEGQGLTDKELRDVFVNFMLAGYVFVSGTLDEIDTVLGGSKVPMTYEILLQGMPYLKAVMHETLRLHPPLNKNIKMASHDDVLPCGTKVYAGDFIAFSPWIMGRSRAVWGDDAEVFRPERWIDDLGKFKTQNQFKFNSFNGGPRVCLGQTFATIEILQTTCLLLQRYTFKMTPNHPPVTYKGSITLPMRHPLQTIITPRHGVSPLVAHKK